MSSSQEKSGQVIIGSVKKALSILDVFSRKQQPMTATSISREIGVNFSTTHHLISTLVACGYLEQDPMSKRYRLGPKALHLGLAAEESFQLSEKAQPVLRGLALKVNESANIAVLDGAEVVYVGQAPSHAAIRMFTRLGARAPLHCTGVGKVLLAFKDEQEAMELASASGYFRFTGSTITTWSALRRELAAIRELGYGVDREEREEGVSCVAAPVRVASGEVVAAISVSGPAGRIVQRIDNLAAEVMAAAQALSADLGYTQQDHVRRRSSVG